MTLRRRLPPNCVGLSLPAGAGAPNQEAQSMLEIFHTPRARSHRVIWLCEEMGVPYQAKLEQFGAPSDEFRAVNPLTAFPTVRDGDVTMIDSIAIMLYVMAKHGPTDIDVKPSEPGYARYIQFMMFGESGIAMYGNGLVATKFLCPEGERENWTAGYLKSAIAKRLAFFEQTLGEGPFIMGERFTAADISVAYSLSMMKFAADIELAPALAAYNDRMKERPAFQRAIAVK
jgi:glutathione S-transferase